MKNLITILLFSLYITFAASAQQASISGFVHYEIYYAINAAPEPTPTHFYFSSSESLSISNILKDGEQQIKSQGSKFVQSSGVQSASGGGLGIRVSFGDSIGRRVYRNLKSKEVVTRMPTRPLLAEAYIVREQWVDIDWKIEDNKTKKIGNYMATRAKGSFRGRDYTVWFSYDIPVPFGPWKLHGLPGLILEAEDSEKMMRMYATEIQVPFDLDDILQAPNDVREITHKEEIYIWDNGALLITRALNARLPKDSKGRFEEKNDPTGRKYHPERSFEWEEAAPGKKRKAKK
jgi:GLPGLI family protein